MFVEASHHALLFGSHEEVVEVRGLKPGRGVHPHDEPVSLKDHLQSENQIFQILDAFIHPNVKVYAICIATVNTCSLCNSNKNLLVSTILYSDVRRKKVLLPKTLVRFGMFDWVFDERPVTIFQSCRKGALASLVHVLNHYFRKFLFLRFCASRRTFMIMMMIFIIFLQSFVTLIRSGFQQNPHRSFKCDG